ncbi:hypothetical protein [Oceanirhabdus sp. W0125-5]|uniref:hypothetical protein n=1 Tax=Oceanirhabdus sp. W0125-5 TaxID=2999116 RepID=UPI0022F301E7|nr:hypothetical protein [Oceanirhabdus sp. W0125-5]WBW95409.1 hypothetical protein OW730_17155 [Oceanirhabdus sp. W0125-5]
MMKFLKDLIRSKEFRIGLGIGLIISSILLWNGKSMTEEDIEIRARKMGMKYEWELRAGEVN